MRLQIKNAIRYPALSFVVGLMILFSTGYNHPYAGPPLGAEIKPQDRRDADDLQGSSLQSKIFLLIQEEPGQPVPSLGNAHIQSPGSPHIPYNSDPPTSGPHVPYIIRWGIHKVPIPREIQVHNLEDGGVILHYHCKTNCDDLIFKLEGIMQKYQRKAEIERAKTGLKHPSRYDHLLLAPYPGMDSVITLTAWGRIDTFNEFDEERIDRFIEAYAGIDHHPEKE